MSTPDLTIRPATPVDQPDLRAAIVELQDYERRLHSTRLPGAEIADAYLAWLLPRAGSDRGRAGGRERRHVRGLRCRLG
jgi:hypothetical protein